MARDVVSTRIELDRETDMEIRKIARSEHRTSKRSMAAVILTRVARAWRDDPDSLKRLNLVQH